ncbi:MAG TPA: XrtA system polysaccharide chain length determinant, partial [Gammaproteobacteria bacterium]|nr:XrtA system polysaccharide chain length determinant [Gammaproteobacteria bacterium]
MQEMMNQLLTYLRGVWRFRWSVLLMAWAIAIGAWALVYYLPDQYEANARVHVDTYSMLKPLLKGMVVDTNTQQRLRLMSKTLLSRPNLEKVARNTDMDLKVHNRAQMENLIDKLRGRIQLKATGDLNLYEISYRDTNPKRAKHVVQSLLNIFVEKSLGETRQDSETAQDFLHRKLKQYGKRLDKAENRLMNFKRKHAGEMPDEKGDYYQRLQGKIAKLKQARIHLQTAQKRRDSLKQQLIGEKPTYGITPRTVRTSGETAPSHLDKRISKLQQQLDQLRLQYTDKHPDVQNLMATIKKLKEKRKHAQATHKVAASTSDQDQSSGGGINLATNDYYQSLRTALAEAKAEVAEAKSRVSQYKKQVDGLKQKVDIIPKVEAKLARLNRTYRVNKKNYEKILSRLQSARISEEVGQSTDDVKFQVVDPPQVPVKPVAPNRPLLVSGGLFGGVGAGLVLGVLMAQIRPVFDSRRSLFETTGLPV